MDKLTITAESGRDLLRANPGEQANDYYFKVTEQVDGSGRWTEHRTVVFRQLFNLNDYWAFDYEVGLTEYQENEYPWEHSDKVECYRVEPHVVITIEYRKL